MTKTKGMMPFLLKNVTFYPPFELKFEIKAPKSYPQTISELDPMKTGEVRILRWHKS